MKNGGALSVVKRFIDLDPVQAAMALEALDEKEAASILNSLGARASAECLQHAMPSFSAGVLQRLPPQSANEILERLPADRSADVFRAFSEESRKSLIEGLGEARRKELQEILSYPEDSAGRLMKADFIAFPKEMKVREVITRLRSLAAKHPGAIYTYVVGAENRLVGVLNMRDLLLAPSDATVESAMRSDVFALPAFTPREELISAAQKTHFLSIPIIDAQGRLLGVVRTQDLFLSGQEDASEDLQLMFGASKEERALSGLGFKVKKRLPWLHVNLATAFLAASVVALYQDLIARMAVLAVFLPITAGMGGNAGIQSLAVVMRGLALREIRPGDALRLVRTEVAVGLANGLVIGALTGVIAWAWQGQPLLGLVIGLGMVVNLMAAGLAGAAIPLAMKRLGLDPAQCSGIFLTTVTDIVGFFAFLQFARLLLLR